MNKAKFWGFEVSHVVASFFTLTASNILLNILGAPVILSWLIGGATLLALRVMSHGQKNGHLELLARYVTEPHLFLGHQGRNVVCRSEQ